MDLRVRRWNACLVLSWLNICSHSSIGHVMDVRDVAFDAGTFDVAIDKGTMDAMMTAKGDVWVCQLPSH